MTCPASQPQAAAVLAEIVCGAADHNVDAAFVRGHCVSL